MDKYNKTQLTPQKEFERHIYHRDQFAHYFRWSHVYKIAKIGQSILDMGCGTGEMYELFYRNRYSPDYLGLDIRENAIREANHKFLLTDARFKVQDLCKPFDLGKKYEIITSFEVIEHIGHSNIDVYLSNIVTHADKNTLILISTPNYDPSVGVAANHMLNNGTEIGEWEHKALQSKLEEYFVIKKKYGTFASISDYKHLLKGWQLEMFNALSEYYDVNLLACLMAPFFPEQSRNTLWELKIK
jgi:2-polyprenyl-3-methyl-5-hydroxy-6-metoxy-1,4-benzoquinol methylase